MVIARQLKQLEKAPELKERRIGLALSGGGFRAAIFHLGVIRRLEELGIMGQVDVISAVSGGSIIAAYYVCEMERRLRLVPDKDRIRREVRVKIFEEIAEAFLAVLDKNLRSRALAFTPYYHPWLFIKTLFLKPFRPTARSVLIQREYDKWFYNGNSMDQLPATASGKELKENEHLFGPKLLLNTTSLLTGERVSFSREPVSGVKEMHKVNKNILLLSMVVGASSGVPGLFPPTTIGGDMLIDGGVADNQGIESLIDDPVNCNLLLISDASGQMEAQNSIGVGTLTVLMRTNSTLQFQVRSKLIDILVAWKWLDTVVHEHRLFAFIHLFLSLKDRPNVSHRVSSEFIPAIARIRTDLDQFSYVEREALMYHGYTLMDAQIRQYCPEVLEPQGMEGDYSKDEATARLKTPPLFRESVVNDPESRDAIRKELEAGAQNVYLLRCLKKYPGPVASVLGTGVVAAGVVVSLILNVWPQVLEEIAANLLTPLSCRIPWFATELIDKLLRQVGITDMSTIVGGLSTIVALLILLFLGLYLVIFPVYVTVRRIAAARDRKAYKSLTGTDPSTHWDG